MYEKFSDIYPIHPDIKVNDPLPGFLEASERGRSILTRSFNATRKTGVEHGIAQFYNFYTQKVRTEYAKGNVHNDVSDLAAGVLGSLVMPAARPGEELSLVEYHLHPVGSTFTLSRNDWMNVVDSRFMMPTYLEMFGEFFPTLHIVGEADEHDKKNGYLLVLQNSYRYSSPNPSKTSRRALIEQLRTDLDWSDYAGIDYYKYGEQIVENIQRYKIAAKILQVTLGSTVSTTIIAENNEPWDYNVYDIPFNYTGSE